MKNIIQLSLVTAIIAVVGTGAAFADDPQLQNWLALERQAAQRQQMTTVAMYTQEQGVGQKASMQQDRRTEKRFELRFNAHGGVYGAHVPGK
ncbi:MAG TPA: hypothetical protein VIT91_07280 [Chthoniobacterales bacterium]